MYVFARKRVILDQFQNLFVKISTLLAILLRASEFYLASYLIATVNVNKQVPYNFKTFAGFSEEFSNWLDLDMSMKKSKRLLVYCLCTHCTRGQKLDTNLEIINS